MVTFSELKRLELDAIRAIQTDGVFGRLSSLLTAARGAQIIPASSSPVNVHLSFTLPTRLREDAGRKAIERPFLVGCFATAAPGKDEISQLSYSVLIGRASAPSTEVARKFHFDFEPSEFRNQGESKPTFHLQICGELSKHHAAAGYAEADIAHLLPAWSQPRIPSQPMSLILILNWLFIEFGHETVVRSARLSPRWRSLVRSAERAILKPYYDACSTFLAAKTNDDESFFSRHIYEER